MDVEYVFDDEPCCQQHRYREPTNVTTVSTELRITCRQHHALRQALGLGEAHVFLREGVDRRRAHVTAEPGDVDERQRQHGQDESERVREDSRGGAVIVPASGGSRCVPMLNTASPPIEQAQRPGPAAAPTLSGRFCGLVDDGAPLERSPAALRSSGRSGRGRVRIRPLAIVLSDQRADTVVEVGREE